MKIKLTGTRPGVAIVDEDDYYQLIDLSWHMNADGYVCSAVNNKMVQMHRFIMKFPAGKKVDHINGKKYDNRKCNLRITDAIGNGQNKQVSKNKTSSKYKGVFYKKDIKKYQTKLIVNKKDVYLGSYDTEIEAAVVYDKYIIHNNHEFFPLNFPNKKEEFLKEEYIPFVSNKEIKSCKYTGVTKTKTDSKYRAALSYKGKNIFSFRSINALECAKAYDKFIVDNKIPWKQLNFPDDYPDYNPDCIIIQTFCKEIKNDKNIVQLLINSRPNIFVIIDKEDYDKIKFYSWYISAAGYLVAKMNGIVRKFSRYIMNVTDPNIFIDHINSNILDNTKQNLRLSNHGKNSQNKSKRKNKTSSKYMGVTYHKNNKKWESRIIFKGVSIPIGTDSNENYAARRRDLFIQDYLKDEHYKLNFIWTPDDIIKWRKILPVSMPTRRQYMDGTSKYRNIISDAIADNDLAKIKVFNDILNTRINNRIDVLTDTIG